MTPCAPSERTSETSDRFAAARMEPWVRRAVSKLRPEKLGATGTPFVEWSIVRVAMSSARARLPRKAPAAIIVAQQPVRTSRREWPVSALPVFLFTGVGFSFLRALTNPGLDRHAGRR